LVLQPRTKTPLFSFSSSSPTTSPAVKATFSLCHFYFQHLSQYHFRHEDLLHCHILLLPLLPPASKTLLLLPTLTSQCPMLPQPPSPSASTSQYVISLAMNNIFLDLLSYYHYLL
ncbi:hypothetical protein NDU88_001665, partial [Pleurodeles waltl]